LGGSRITLSLGEYSELAINLASSVGLNTRLLKTLAVVLGWFQDNSLAWRGLELAINLASSEGLSVRLLAVVLG
jgi:hypothetical protein